MSDARLRGTEAENLAADFLLAQGYVIITRRFKQGRGEIDLIALDGDVLVFVEVKLSDKGHEAAIQNLTEDKRSRMGQTAAAYQALVGEEARRARFDVITVHAGTCQHWRDAFGDWDEADHSRT